MKIKKSHPTPPMFQRLLVPAGWFVAYNTFIDIDPKNLNVDDERWISFTQDLLQLRHKRSNILLDLGWYPDGDSNGAYKIELIKDDDWMNPIKSFNSNSKDEIVKMIELLLWQVSVGFIK